MKFTKKMKKLLIASSVLAVIGVVLCIAGFAVSGEKELFSQKQNDEGQYVYTYEFDASLIKKISLELEYADVNVIKTSGSGMIEMINYPLDNFGMTVGATTVAIEEKSALGNLFSFNFDGFRNYFNSAKMASKNRTVNIYLPEGNGIKLIDIDIYSGDANISKLLADTDFEIEIDYGSAFIENVVSSGNLSVNISEGNLVIKNSEIYSNTSELTYGYEEIANSIITEIDAEIKKGYFKYETGGDSLLSSVLRLKTDNGRVRFGGDIYENGSFSQGMEYTGVSGVVQTVINVHVGEGNIMITE
ncbi:MAG: DUF4097 family beta strand repeat protein [Clostridia bacterium]|nr:DUF4097 family beta strand repeat protein [Clostridia bacterium]